MSDNPGHRSRNRPNDIFADIEFSILLSRSLDVIGYNQNLIKLKVDYWKLNDSLCKIKFESEMTYAGSQTEGVVTYFESDMDMMIVNSTVICADNPLQFIDDKNITVFQTDNRDTEPGYTKLKLIQMGNVNSYIKESLFISENGNRYISSDFITDMLMFDDRHIHNLSLSKAGPAIPIVSTFMPEIVNDAVYCFKCYCPALLRSFLRRPRRYNWPPRNILYDISQMEAHVVPVGCKGSNEYYQEWRICFTKAEIHLIHNFNDTQIKMYIILKMVAKTILKNICPEITSYIIKNIVLWMCELTPSEHFTEHQLVNRIFRALEFLKKCVLQNFLPSYMIPERNLFHNRIEPGQKQELIESLSSFIEEGPAALFHRLGKIRGAMSFVYQDPRRAAFFGILRDHVETLVLLRVLREMLIVPLDSTEEQEIQIVSQDELSKNIDTWLVVFVNILSQSRNIESVQGFSEKQKTILS